MPTHHLHKIFFLSSVAKSLVPWHTLKRGEASHLNCSSSTMVNTGNIVRFRMWIGGDRKKKKKALSPLCPCGVGQPCTSENLIFRSTIPAQLNETGSERSIGCGGGRGEGISLL